MGLNIKNERVHHLAREAARVTGKTQTGAIEEALVRLLAAHGEDPAESMRQRRLDVVRGISADYQALPLRPGCEHLTELDLYDDDGLPG